MKKYLLILAAILACTGMVQAKEPQQPTNYAYVRGVEAFNNDEYADAIDWFNRELSEHPDNGYALVYIGILRYGNEEYGRALTAIENALKKLPKNDSRWRAMGYATRSKVHLAMEDTLTALNDLSQAIKIAPKEPSHIEARAQLYYKQSDFDWSNADYQRLIALDPGDVMGYMGLGRNANMQKNWEEALQQFSYVIKLAPDYASGYSFRADAYLGLEKWNEATDDIIKALDIDGDDKAFYQLKNIPDQATSLLRTKLKIIQAKQSSNRYWPYCLGVLAEEKGDYEQAIQYFLQANDMDANSFFLERVAQCYVELEQYAKALDYVNRALAMNPTDLDLVDFKARTLLLMSRNEEALVECNKIVREYPDRAEAYLTRAEVLMFLRRYQDVIDDYATAMVLAPVLNQYSYLLVRRGDAYRLSGQKEPADADYKAVIEQEKDSLLTSDSWLPFAYSGLGNNEKAIETMRYIVENDTTDALGNLYNLVCIYARTGNSNAAIQTLDEVIKKGYTDVGHIKTDYDLDSLRDIPAFIDLVNSLEEAIQTESEGDSADEFTYETVEVPFTKAGGVTKVKCSINGLPLHFVFDTGAADVTMSMVEANFMMKNDYIQPDDIIGSARYVDANGDISEGTVINLRKVDFGGLELDNVRASVVRNQKAPLLLGQSVLGRLGKIEIDNPSQTLKITHKRPK